MSKDNKELQEQINQLTNERDKYLDIAQRAQADLVNYRKKSSIDLQESEARSQRRILHQIIMILDQINMALSAKVNTKTYKSWIEGISSINKKWKIYLESDRYIRQDYIVICSALNTQKILKPFTIGIM